MPTQDTTDTDLNIHEHIEHIVNTIDFELIAVSRF